MLHICRSGADFLGPLLPAVAEICSDFDPTIDVEPSLLKLFRNLWFYIALFGLAPPIQKGQVTTKSVSTSLNSVGSMGVIAVQAVGGPYMWNAQWASAVQRISQGTPPLVSSYFLYTHAHTHLTSFDFHHILYYFTNLARTLGFWLSTAQLLVQYICLLLIVVLSKFLDV